MKYLISIIFLFSCSQAVKLGNNRHIINKNAQNIIWIQLPGFSEQHLTLLKFTKWNTNTGKEFENFSCYGKSWDYSLFDIRPKAGVLLNSQLSASSFEKNSCEDYKNLPFYQSPKFLESSKILIEEGKSNFLISDKLDCNKSSWLKNVFYLARNNSNIASAKKFHATNSKSLDNGIYQDQSCLKDKCFSSLPAVIDSLESRLFNDNFVFIYRNYNYLNHLEKKDYKSAESVLVEVEEFLSHIKTHYSLKNTLVLLTSGATVNLDFPFQGRDWGNLEYTTQTSKRDLLSSVFAFGASAEKFCGIQEASDLARKL